MNAKKSISTTNNISFQQLDGQSILGASIEAAYPINHSCHSGRCGFCKAKVLSGETHPYRQENLTQQELDDNWILTCARTALSDVKIDVGKLTKVDIPKSVTIPCVITALELLTDDILKVTLQLPLIARLPYIAGQHVDITSPQGICRSYSLAKAKVEKQKIELHIHKVNNGAMSNFWFSQAKLNDILTLQGSKGTFFLRDIADKDIYFLATGTGIAPINAMLESIFTPAETANPSVNPPRSITVIWGAKTKDSFYLDPSIYSDYSHKAERIKFIPTLSVKDKNWRGAYGYVQKVLMEQKPNLANARVYACGSPVMIEHAQELLRKNGLNEQHFLADAFVSSY